MELVVLPLSSTDIVRYIDSRKIRRQKNNINILIYRYEDFGAQRKQRRRRRKGTKKELEKWVKQGKFLYFRICVHFLYSR